MEIRKLLTDDDAVSPVIGVILMVAITVILAAVIGAFVLGFGGGGPSAPSATWDTTDNASDGGNVTVTFSHSGGDTIEDADTVLTITGSGITETQQNAPSTMQTGSEIYGWNTSSSTAIEGEYNLVWEPSSGDSSQELATHSV